MRTFFQIDVLVVEGQVLVLKIVEAEENVTRNIDLTINRKTKGNFNFLAVQNRSIVDFIILVLVIKDFKIL